jgi:hypothetical protein
MLFRLIDTSWKIVLVGLVVIVGHGLWFHLSHDPMVIPRCGAAFIILGVVIAARGFFREGLDAAVNRQLPAFPFAPFYSEQGHREWTEARDKVRPEIEKDVRAERQWAFSLIVLGTAINGYGDLGACFLRRFI